MNGRPALPYAGTSGWSGSDTSRERAQRDDDDGTTSARQGQVIFALANEGVFGMTVKELRAEFGWHHGQASGVLSVLHKVGSIDRLVERRDRCAVYVLPQFRCGRDTVSQGRDDPPPPERAILLDLIAELVELDRGHRDGAVRSDDVHDAARCAEARLREVAR